MNLIKQSTNRRPSLPTYVFTTLALLFVLGQPRAALAQWTTSGNNISNTNTGNVGIGTTTPTYKLDVADSGYNTFAARLIQSNSAASNGLSIHTQTAEAADAALNVFSNAGAILGLSVRNNGRVGIGTPAPGTKLHVIGTQGSIGAGTFQLDTSTSFSGWTAAYPAFEIVNTNQTNNNVSLFQFADAPSGASHAGIGAVNTSHVNKYGNLFFYTKQADGYQVRMGIYGGNVGIGTTAPEAMLHIAGDVKVDGNLTAQNQDLAEWVPSTQQLAAGTVVALDPGRMNHVVASASAYDTKVAGVISAQPGITLGEAGAGKVMVATTGRVRVKVDATRRPIRIGDLLVTSDRAGLAMPSVPVEVGGVQMHRPGTVIGKALEPLAGGVGEILVLLSLQ